MTFLVAGLPCVSRHDPGTRCTQVIAEPDTHVIVRDADRDDFVLLACDGVWDVMSNETAIKFVHTRLKKTRNLENVVGRLVRRCLQLGSRDNITVLLVVISPKHADLVVQVATVGCAMGVGVVQLVSACVRESCIWSLSA